MEENDVKIYGSEKSRKEQSDIGAVLEAVNRQRTNGNIEKARRLGKRLATINPTEQENALSLELEEHLKHKFFAPTIMYQIKVLLVFAAEAAIQIYLPSELLATTATNAVYDSLRKYSPDFYKNISDGAAFTFYYLAVKKGGSIEENIGETFAMLCGAEDNDSFAQAGQTVYRLALEVIIKEINAVKFEAV